MLQELILSFLPNLGSSYTKVDFPESAIADSLEDLVLDFKTNIIMRLTAQLMYK